MCKQSTKVSIRDAIGRARARAINVFGRSAVETGIYPRVSVNNRIEKLKRVPTMFCAAVDGTPDTWKFPTRLQCLELFTGKGRASEYYALRGGESKRIGLRYEHDLKVKSVRDFIPQVVESTDPLCLVVSPPCTPWVTWQNVNMVKNAELN